MFIELTEKQLKIEKYLNAYGRKLFNNNCFSKWPKILFKIGFVACEMKVYAWNFYF